MKKNSTNILLIVATVIFIVAGLVFIGNLVYPAIYGFINPKTKMNLKSDAEMITQFQARKEEFNQLIPKESQYWKEMGNLEMEIKNKNEVIQNQIYEIYKTKNPDYPLTRQLISEQYKNNRLLDTTKKERRAEIDTFLNGLLNGQDFHFFSMEGGNLMYAQSYEYKEYHLFIDRHDFYYLAKGLILFRENNQPDKQYVVDNLDNFHSSGNIILTAQKFAKKFGEKGTIYVHLEGNWYLFLRVLMGGVKCPPDNNYCA